MLFTGDESLKKVKVLSGGEKVRCMLSKLMLSGANCITMDDPTNHLDLEAIQSLNEGLIAFPGVLLFSSHDHEFIQSIANRIVEITPNGIIDRMMSFDDYITDPQVTELRKKLYEGTGKFFLKKMKTAFTSNIKSKLGALLVKGSLKDTLKQVDASNYGGAPFLGLKGLVVKTHGSANEIEIKNSILQCVTFTEQKISEKISAKISQG
jgi:ABC-type multidrug transport system ATPase subunit